MRSILGDMPPALFLERHWQKEPLLVRQALPGFDGILSQGALFELASREDALSRLVIEHPKKKKAQERWEVGEGPFDDLDPADLPASHWTLLVQGLEGLAPGGWELLRRFSFLPAARIDDLMVSFAAPGGSVGPHVDKYDVFLLQGPGRRRWQWQVGGDQSADEDAPLKLLTNFVPDEEQVLEPGDMLYLPPGVAHWGTAVDDCFTYSIGFLAPSHEQLVQNFLPYLGQKLAPHLDPMHLYADPDLRVPSDPIEVGDDMVAKVTSILGAVRYGREDVEEFIGRLLTGPKPHVMFEEPHRPLSLAAFTRKLEAGAQLALALPSRALVKNRMSFLNGERFDLDDAGTLVFRALARDRSASARQLSPAAAAVFHAWYRAGYVTLARS